MAASRRLAAGLLCGVCFPLTVLAQEPVMLEGIVLTAEEQAALGRVEIGAERLEDVATGSLDDVFAEEPAVSVGGGIALTEQVFVNGIDQQQLAVTVDGASQNNSLFHHTGTNVIDPGLLKAVRVDPGRRGRGCGPLCAGGQPRLYHEIGHRPAGAGPDLRRQGHDGLFGQWQHGHGRADALWQAGAGRRASVPAPRQR